MSSNGINMDDVKSYQQDMEKRQQANKSKFTASLPVLLSVLALTGIAGMIWFAYTQGVKTGSEDFAPIVSSNQPLKTQPENAGGKTFNHQDKQVYNNIDNPSQTNSVKAIPAKALPANKPNTQNITNNTNSLLPAKAPKTLLSSDQSNTQKQSVSTSAVSIDNSQQSNASNVNQPATPKNQQANNNLSAPTSLSLLSLATIAERTNAKPKNIKPQNAAPQPVQQVNAQQPKVQQPKPPTQQKPANPLLSSTEVAPKPQTQKQQNKPQQVAQTNTSQSNNNQTNNLAQNNNNAQNANSWRVQIAAARSLQAARSEWVRRSKQFPEFFNNYELFIDRIKKNDGSEWFRVQITGFQNRDAAQQHCNGLKTVKISCFIVRPS